MVVNDFNTFLVKEQEINYVQFLRIIEQLVSIYSLLGEKDLNIEICEFYNKVMSVESIS
jgi:hypothetical protein